MIQVTAHDADDPAYGNSARLVYTVLEGLPFFSVDPQTGTQWGGGTEVGWRGSVMSFTTLCREGETAEKEKCVACLRVLIGPDGLHL